MRISLENIIHHFSSLASIESTDANLYLFSAKQKRISGFESETKGISTIAENRKAELYI
jgi:hypothetical protein